MQYQRSELERLKLKMFHQICNEFDEANDADEIEIVLDKYNIVFDENCVPVNRRTMKIIVIGALAGNINDYYIAAKRMGISRENIIFENDYAKLSNYNVEKLRNSFEYSDIITGPMPHSMEGKGDYSSLISAIIKNPNEYPRLLKAENNNVPKISISQFRNCLARSRYRDAMP